MIRTVAVEDPQTYRLQPPQLIKAHGGASHSLGTRLGRTAPLGASAPPTSTQVLWAPGTRGDENNLTPQNQNPEKRVSMPGQPS